MKNFNRRDFLATSSLSLVGLGLGVRSLGAMPTRSAQPVGDFFPEAIEPDSLRTLALAGIDAARSAGASYADIRVADRRMLQMMLIIPPMPESSMGFDYSFGIRVWVDGASAFVYGSRPSVDAIAAAAREAVATARAMTRVAGPAPHMVAAPVVKGEWATPIKIDPFAVSPDEHAYTLGAFKNAAGRVVDAGMAPAFYWSSETRVFANTEGSLVTQRLAQARPRISASVFPPVGDGASIMVGDISPISAGFEIVVGPAAQERIKEVAEDAARLIGYPEGDVNVGRYEMVLDGMSVGAVLGATLVQALEHERVLGFEADAAGTSMLAPPNEVLGEQLFSPQLNLAADRAMPHYGAAKWDDEGVETEAFPVIEEGKVVDYFTTRASASTLADWYHKRGLPVKSHGAAIAWSPTRAPVGSASHITMKPRTSAMSLDALTSQIKDGVLIRGLDYVSSDQQLAGGTFIPYMAFEVKKGKIVRRLRDAQIQFGTQRFWKGLTGVGDAQSMQAYTRNAVRGQPWAATTQAIVAPAAHFAEVNLTQFNTRMYAR